MASCLRSICARPYILRLVAGRRDYYAKSNRHRVSTDWVAETGAHVKVKCCAARKGEVATALAWHAHNFAHARVDRPAQLKQGTFYMMKMTES